MATVWDRIKQLDGQTLRTKTGKPFRVISVDSDYVIVEPERTGVARSIRRTDLESAYDLHVPLEELTATRLVKEQGTSFNPVYIVSILKAIAGTTSDETRPKTKTVPPSEQNSAEEFISQLERIHKLHQEGTLSDRDFAQAKLKLLKVTE